MSRIRTRDETGPQGTWERYGIVSGGGIVKMKSERCLDEVLSGDNHYFLVDKETFGGGFLNTQGPYNPAYPTYYNYRNDAMTYNGVFPLIDSFDGTLSNIAYATMTAARTNPSRPYVDVPVNVLELADVARILQSAGNTLRKQLGGNYLKYHFGIAPLVGDLIKLTQFQAQVDRRVKEMKKLRDRGLRRTIDLAAYSTSGIIPNLVIQSLGALIYDHFTYSSTQIVRGHARWNAGTNLDNLSDEVMSALARRAVLGLTLDFATFWEAMPWSWLLDWCGGIGNFLKANRNIIPATLDSVRVMKHTHTVYKNPGFQVGTLNISPSVVTKERKERIAAMVAPTAHFPFLSGHQMGILGSLALVRS